MQAVAALGDGPVRTTLVAQHLRRPLTSLSAVRDELLRKGLVYSPERGFVAFTGPAPAGSTSGRASFPVVAR